ncbi:siderophore ferric iron reductase [Vibrio scophthalmi]|uniref:siderophore ferric iron reductase n=1 Tax=Vibrio scophthalmi TaxID=45658 RepID=UPI003EBFD7D7
MSGDAFFDQLFKRSLQLTPYLHGSIKPFVKNDDVELSLIRIEQSSSELIHDLYLSLKDAHPEAGAPYWLTRTWTLLCWQPIYVAFIAIYGCRGLPKLTTIAQQVVPNFVTGYQFSSNEFSQGSERELIARAGQDLNILFDYFRQEMAHWTRIRPGFTQHLFADAILACIVKLHQFAPHLSSKYLFEQARYWLMACDLPEKLINSLSYDVDIQKLSLVRTSCCLVIKCQGRKLCSDCPRHPSNNR